MELGTPLKTRATPWTMSELQYVRETYPTTDANVIADKLGRTRNAVRQRALLLSVKKERHEISEEGMFSHALFKLERVMKLIRFLHDAPRKITTIQDELQLSKRSAYRYISMLQAAGIDVKKVGVRFTIEFKDCPLCGYTTNNH